MITDGDIDEAMKFFDDPFGHENQAPKEKKNKSKEFVDDQHHEEIEESIELNLSRD
tara:strand:- start:427 stop:594 length:168 start_codon:yes stop_codon:yes gene_type:complete